MKKHSAVIAKIKNNLERLFFPLVFALIFIRYCYYGFSYFYQLDDYIQYHNLTAGTQSIWALLTSLGLLGNRPLAWMADLFVWSHLFPVMIFGVAVISALFAASACLFRHVFSRHFGTSPIFLFVYTLLPLGFEGTYWMSAATRIVVGLFFAAAALDAFDRWCDSGRIRLLILFFFCQLLACGFYEQVLIFSVTAILLFSGIHLKKHRLRALFGLLSLVNAGLAFLFEQFFSHNSVFSGRGTLAVMRDTSYWTTVFPGVLRQMKSAFLGGGFYTLFKGFARGVTLMLSDFNGWYALGLVLLVAVVFFTVKFSDNRTSRPKLALLAGLILAVAPVTIFFVLADGWFSLRGTVTSFCGVALFADTQFLCLVGRLGNRRLIAATLAALFVFACCVASVSELHDYRQTTLQDTAFTSRLSAALRADKLMKKDLRVGIINLNASYLNDQNYFYHEHIHGVTESGWALHGALESISGYYIPDLEPLPENPMAAPWDGDTKRLDTFDALYYDDGVTLERVTAVRRPDGQFDVFSAAGEQLGYTVVADGYTTFIETR
ncbi:hypothetical protein IZU99_09695 [Oscillospiraceae bacterium CM]|nr:hypothetical protein IZU99_09695 [Oscillospiraceae bacterium CM]